jgi:predicted nucleic acid-binding protein
MTDCAVDLEGLRGSLQFAELTYGVQASVAGKRKQNQAVLDSLALHLAVLDWPQEAALHDAEIRLDLKKRGAQLGAADLMIAAHARVLGLRSSRTTPRTSDASRACKSRTGLTSKAKEPCRRTSLTTARAGARMPSRRTDSTQVRLDRRPAAP